MKYLCTKHCSSKPTACGGVDEAGIAIQPEPVCMRLKVCPTKERLADVPKNVMTLVKEFQEFLNGFSGALKKKPKDNSKAEKLKQLKKELKEQLDQINKKMQFELEFFRQEMKPLKNEKQQLLERLSELK